MAAIRSSAHALASPQSRHCSQAGADTTATAIAEALAAGLEQQRNIENDQRLALPPRPAEERLALTRHQRVQDAFERGERRGLAENTRAEGATIDRAIPDHAGKRRVDHRNRQTAAAPSTGERRDRHRRPVLPVGETSLPPCSCPWRWNR